MPTTVIRIPSGWLLPGMIIPRLVIVIVIITVTVRWSPDAAFPLGLGALLAALLLGERGQR